jgi:hypothetical protein
VGSVPPRPGPPAPAFDQRGHRGAAITSRAQRAPGENGVWRPLNTEVAIVASPPGGLLTGQVLQQEPHAARGPQVHEARVDVGVVDIQHLQRCSRAVGPGDPADGTGDEAEAPRIRADAPAPPLSRHGRRFLVLLPPEQCTSASPGVHDTGGFAAWGHGHDGAAGGEIRERRGSDQRGGRPGPPMRSWGGALRRCRPPEDLTARAQALRARGQGGDGHRVIAGVMPRHVGMTRHATAAQRLSQGGGGPPGDRSRMSSSIISAEQDGFSSSAPATRLLRRRACWRVPGTVWRRQHGPGAVMPPGDRHDEARHGHQYKPTRSSRQKPQAPGLGLFLASIIFQGCAVGQGWCDWALTGVLSSVPKAVFQGCSEHVYL